MSDFRIDQITNKAGTAGPDIAGITTFSGSSGLLMPSGNTFRRSVLDDVVQDGLVLYLDAGNDVSYPGSGTNWFDLSGNGNNGTLVNGVGYSASNGGALVFDGVDDYGITNQNLIFSTDAALTISFWFKTNLLTLDGAYFRRVLSFTNNYGILTDTNSVGWYANGANLITPVAILTGVWYKVDNIYTGSQYQTYINGILGNSFTASFPSISSQLWIGIYHLSNDGRFNGNISQVSLYNRALTAQEIQQNYNAFEGRYT